MSASPSLWSQLTATVRAVDRHNHDHLCVGVSICVAGIASSLVEQLKEAGEIVEVTTAGGGVYYGESSSITEPTIQPNLEAAPAPEPEPEPEPNLCAE